ncbi:metallo-beta-lactamase [Mangrovibacter sp. MFB070]|uniref:MBL fold metallo-hydrolase n=1 Tax=Mangrovibacter sp. MFB070 TaxID=1224318 RepID=UPI0004D9E852|nr:MBL fold metallo-hydrolase [Mangrovibacter sp. MFB070]KEA53524.1 metallo-beta-lactamase [Mangrovibacter sp. MFB070]
MATITEFEVGYCTHIGCMALKGAGVRVCKFPARAWLLEVGDKRWLWDTGYSDWFGSATRRGVFRIYRHMTPVHFSSHQALVNQLQACGLHARDLTGIILSHFHADHVAGLRDFPGVTSICSGDGWQQVRALRGFRALRQAFIPALIPPEFESSLQFIEAFPLVELPGELSPFTRGYVLPGSEGQIFLVPLPGHAPGHIGAFVQTDDSWVLLASDAAWSATSYRELRGPARLAHLVMGNPQQFYQTLQSLHTLSQCGQVTIRLCHEGDL